eukprot:8932574-Pyramimonas_sp.AAC.1
MTRCPLDSRTPWPTGQAPGHAPPNGLDGAREPRRQTLQRQLFPCLAKAAGAPLLPARRDAQSSAAFAGLPRQGDRTRRHNKLRNGAFFDAQAAGFSGAELERPGLLPPRAPGEGPSAEELHGDGLDNDGRRPAD